MFFGLNHTNAVMKRISIFGDLRLSRFYCENIDRNMSRFMWTCECITYFFRMLRIFLLTFIHRIFNVIFETPSKISHFKTKLKKLSSSTTENGTERTKILIKNSLIKFFVFCSAVLSKLVNSHSLIQWILMEWILVNSSYACALYAKPCVCVWTGLEHPLGTIQSTTIIHSNDMVSLKSEAQM